MAVKLMLCDCGGTQTLDADAISRATGLNCSRVRSGLCMSQIAEAAKAMQEGETIIACRQESPVFEALATELDLDAPLFVDIRDRAGWSDEGKDATPKIAALLAEAQLPGKTARIRDVTSEGICLIIGSAAVALPAAEQLAETLSVTCLLSDAEEQVPGAIRSFDVLSGRVRNASGSLGKFELSVDALRSTESAGRGALGFSAPRDGAKTSCDLILDLSGGQPLFPAPEKRDGYLRADPGDPLVVARAVFEASHMVGVFEKPLYIRFEESLCAHSRAGQPACNRCLDLCPTGAITPNGDTVAIDADICAGCGACAAVCPSGAATYDDPAPANLFARIRTLATSFHAAGGTAPRLLVHDESHGREMIALSARLGRGLPADVLPLEVSALSGFGHAEVMVAFATGFAGVTILAGPRTERDALEPQMNLASALIAGLGRDDTINLIEPADPEVLSELLYAQTLAAPSPVDPILPLGGRRDATRLAARALATNSEGSVPLPEGAPYGAVLVDTEACTLCLSCAGLCPTGALGDNPDLPQLRFQEDACIQCGLCANICPENAITLQPQLNLAATAMTQRVLHEEEPYPCIECGKLFGVKSTIERIVTMLENKHSMFTNSDNSRLIRMCDDCRVNAQYHAASAPFQGGPRSKIRTTEDELKNRKDS